MSARDDILGQLPATLQYLSSELDLTVNGVRYHLNRMEQVGVVGRRRAPLTGERGQPAYEFFLIQAPEALPSKECACCNVVKEYDRFYAGREGTSICCKDCYEDQPGEVAAVRRSHDLMKQNARRGKGAQLVDATIREYLRVLAKDPCTYCGSSMMLADHIDALSRNGQHEWENLTPACGSCNSKKSAKPLLEFLLEVSS